MLKTYPIVVPIMLLCLQGCRREFNGPIAGVLVEPGMFAVADFDGQNLELNKNKNKIYLRYKEGGEFTRLEVSRSMISIDEDDSLIVVRPTEAKVVEFKGVERDVLDRFNTELENF